MEKDIPQTILWIGGIGTAFITILLTVIAYFLNSIKDWVIVVVTDHEKQFKKNDKKFNRQQKQIYELAADNREQLGIIKSKLKIS